MNNDNRKGYKAFKPGLICAPDKNHIKQYAENTVFEESGGEICGEGMMHYCTYPLDVLAYYPPVCENGTGFTEYAEVEALDEPVTDDKIKYATKKLRVGAKISFGNLVKASVKYVLDRVDKTKNGTGHYSGNSQTGDYSGNSQTGYYSGNSQTGYYSGNSQTGDRSGNSQTGDYSGNSQTGHYSGNSQTGDRSGNSQTGHYSGNSQTGYYSGNSQTGYYSGNSQTGHYSGNSQTGDYSGNSQTGDRSYSEQRGAFSASVSTGYGCSHYAAGKQCIAVAWGANSTAKGKKGSYICLAEWNEECTKIINAKFAEIDGEIIKEDTLYKLVDGEFVEVTA